LLLGATLGAAPPRGEGEKSDEVALEAKGYVVAAHAVQVSPKVSGTIVWVHEKFEEGQRFKEGEVLARLEDEEYKADHDAAAASLKRAKARLDALSAGPPAKPLDLTLAKADLEEAEAKLRKAKWRLDGCTVRAPIAGTVLARKAEKGNYVNPAAYQVSASLCEMADLSDLEIDVSIAERDIARLAAGQRCTVMPEAFAKDRGFLRKHPGGYKATLVRILPVADRARGAIPVRVKIDKGEIPAEEHGVYLKPDMAVIVAFTKPKSES
jgi:multidrug resistance efflux pump